MGLISVSDQTPWSTVFSGAGGKFVLLCLLTSLSLVLAMIVHLGVYVNSIITHYSNVICVPYNFYIWSLVVPVALIGLVIFVPFVIWEDLRRKDRKLQCLSIARIMGLVWFFMFFVMIPSIDRTPNSYQSGAIVTEGNSSNSIMYQYRYDGSRALTYHIFFDIDDLAITHPNLTCTYFKAKDLCAWLSPLLYTNMTGAYKCRPGDEQGLELFSPQQGLRFDSAYMFSNISIAFTVFSLITCGLILYRRILSPTKWIGFNRCRQESSKDELASRSSLLSDSSRMYMI